MRPDKTQSVGFHVDADIVFDKSYGLVHEVPSQVLSITDPRLHLYYGLGVMQDGHRPFWVSSFSLEGIFPNIHESLCEGVELTSIGLRLIGLHGMKREGGRLTIGKEYGFSVFGTMHLDIPGCSRPLELAYDMTEMCRSLSLSAQVECNWVHAFSIQKLTVCNLVTPWDFTLFVSSTAARGLLGKL